MYYSADGDSVTLKTGLRILATKFTMRRGPHPAAAAAAAAAAGGADDGCGGDTRRDSGRRQSIARFGAVVAGCVATTCNKHGVLCAG